MLCLLTITMNVCRFSAAWLHYSLIMFVIESVHIHQMFYSEWDFMMDVNIAS